MMDTRAVRQHFSGLRDDWAFFDNAGGSFVLERVVERVAEYLRTTPVQLGGSCPASQLAATRQAEACARLASFVNAASAAEIVLGSSSTALTWQLARAWRPRLRPGDEIIITVMDHEANRSPWLWLQELGVRIRTWNVRRDDFGLDMDQLDELLGERTRLVCFSHCSNILGRIEPVEEITRRAHAAGAHVFVDDVAFAPHRRTNVAASNADFSVCSLYKLFGPHIGMLHGREEALLELGNINHEYLPADALPGKLQPGGVSYELAWGAAGIAEYFEEWRQQGNEPFREIARHEADMTAMLLDHLAAHPRIELFGPGASAADIRLPIISFRHAGMESARIAAELNKRRISVRHGHFHARRLLEFLDVPVHDGVVRISLAHYNTREECERLIDALEEILE